MIKRFFKKHSGWEYDKELTKRLDSEYSSEDSEKEEYGSIDDIEPNAQDYMSRFEKEKKRFLRQQIESEKERNEKELQRLIEDNGMTSNSFSSASPPASSRKEQSEKKEELKDISSPPKSTGLHAEGTLLNIEDLGVGIYKERVPTKGYDMVYILLPDKVTVQGIFLNMYRREIIGKIPPYIFKEIQKTMQWTPEQITAYFSDDRSSYLLPSSAKDLEEIPSVEEKASTPSISLQTLPFGQKLIFKMGDKTWESIYWTKDELGHVVAHNTNGHWQLIHLDLKRFKKMNMLQFGSVLSDQELEKIHDYIKYHSE